MRAIRHRIPISFIYRITQPRYAFLQIVARLFNNTTEYVVKLISSRLIVFAMKPNRDSRLFALHEGCIAGVLNHNPDKRLKCIRLTRHGDFNASLPKTKCPPKQTKWNFMYFFLSNRRRQKVLKEYTLYIAKYFK